VATLRLGTGERAKRASFVEDEKYTRATTKLNQPTQFASLRTFFARRSVLFLFGLFILIAMTRVFITVADCHKAVTKGISKGCNAQRHSNTKNLRLAVTEREKTQLRDANELLRTLSQRIDDKPPLLLFFVIPLTKENVVKLGGCVAASLFATVLRAFLSMENIISATTVVDEL